MHSRDYNHPSNERGRCERRPCDFQLDVLNLLLLFRLEARSTVYLSADFPVHDFSIRVWQVGLRSGTKGSLGRIVAQSFCGGVIMKGNPFGVSLSFWAVVSVHPI